MKIGLIDVDRKDKSCICGGSKPYPNLALCKISAWHKAQGDEVEWYNIFSHYDIVYMSKIFNFTPDYSEIMPNADKVIKGGTAYDVTSRLPEEIDRMTPDYSIYPYIAKNIAYGFLTRGCPNKCSWCVVPKKEGAIQPYMDIEEIAVDGRTNIVLMDNNILAAGDYAKEQLRKIIDRGYRIDFNQALDARLMTEEFAELLAKCKWIDRRIRFGCDTRKQIEDCEKAIEMLQNHGYKGEFFLYTMLTSDFQESYSRINYWWERLRECREKHTANIYPFAQPYRDPYNPNREIPQWQKDMACWVNKHQIFYRVAFKDFEPRKGFKCGWYLC